MAHKFSATCGEKCNTRPTRQHAINSGTCGTKHGLPVSRKEMCPMRRNNLTACNATRIAKRNMHHVRHAMRFATRAARKPADCTQHATRNHARNAKCAAQRNTQRTKHKTSITRSATQRARRTGMNRHHHAQHKRVHIYQMQRMRVNEVFCRPVRRAVEASNNNHSLRKS